MATASGQRKAVVQNNQIFSNNLDGLTNILGTTSRQSLDALGQGRTSAVNALTGQASNALDAVRGGYGQARNDVQAGFGQARNDTLTGIGLFDQFAANGNAANQAQSDFLGLGDTAAADAALARFRGATGYRDIVDSTSDAALRKAAVVGGLGGNQLDELGRIGGQLANQSAQQYFGNLGTVAGQGLTALGQQQQGYNALANQGIAQGGALAGISTGMADREAAINTGLGSALGNAFTGTAAQEASVFGGLGNSLTDLGKFTTNGITSGIFEAGKASDAAKAANENLTMGAVGMGLGLLTAPLTGGASLGGAAGAAGAAKGGPTLLGKVFGY
ncbi:MAG: hypothetical protein C0522_07580 [Rhodocyclaceae bacterium]|nr:hypothetical protein [Rhodocyclaceae bacterium]